MERKQIEQLFEEVKAGRTEIHAAVEKLRHLPYEQMGYTSKWVLPAWIIIGRFAAGFQR